MVGAAVEGWAAQIASMSIGLTWRVKEDSWGGCRGDYANTAGVHAYIYVVFDGPVSDESWPRTLEVVRLSWVPPTSLRPPMDLAITMSSSRVVTACQSYSARGRKRLGCHIGLPAAPGGFAAG